MGLIYTDLWIKGAKMVVVKFQVVTTKVHEKLPTFGKIYTTCFQGHPR